VDAKGGFASSWTTARNQLALSDLANCKKKVIENKIVTINNIIFL
jgi:hypothetical protein|tara:strand:- start:158 stop:292 length:135 start_codon:yes stop_codon:yes gene_type:complete